MRCLFIYINYVISRFPSMKYKHVVDKQVIPNSLVGTYLLVKDSNGIKSCMYIHLPIKL
jgi:hypothetical protein